MPKGRSFYTKGLQQKFSKLKNIVKNVFKIATLTTNMCHIEKVILENLWSFKFLFAVQKD